MSTKERFSKELVVQANRNLYRTERGVRTHDTVSKIEVRATTKSAGELRAAFKNASVKLRTG